MEEDDWTAEYDRIYANINHGQRNKGLRANSPISPKGCRWRIWHIGGISVVYDYDNGLTAFEAHRKARTHALLPHFSQCRLTQILPYPLPTEGILNFSLKEAARYGVAVSYFVDMKSILVAAKIV